MNDIAKKGNIKKWKGYDQQVLSLLKNHNSLSLDTIANLLDLSKTRACLVLESLLKYNLVERYRRKTSYWRIKNEKGRC